MARTREFDKQIVLEKAMMLFWHQGYDATSVRELIRAMGISSSSMYETFGDKRAVYIQALEYYCLQEQRQFRETLTMYDDIRDVLKATFRTSREQMITEPKGMFSINSTVELGSRDPEITDILWQHYQSIWSMFRDALSEAQKRDNIPRSLNADEVAHTILATLYGYTSVLRARPNFHGIDGILNTLKSLFDDKQQPTPDS